VARSLRPDRRLLRGLARQMERMPTAADPPDGARDDSRQRREEDDAARYPGHENPDALRERAGLDDREQAEPSDPPTARDE
jgi:hypothetical protein